MSASSFRISIAVGLVASFVVAGCGPRRPPVVATSGGAAAAADASAPAADEPAQNLEPGPDVQPVEGYGLGQDLLADEGSVEGGPLADVYFGFDQAALSDETRSLLEKHALWLQNRRDVKLLVEGHCDERGTVEYNLALGEQRAQAVRDYLLSLGVSPDRLTSTSYGKERPVDPGHDEAAWARNRRVHFALVR